ncbi:MAG: hypothetical protein WKF55_12215 [Gemmatimonadaceae bacterium]
MNAAPPSSLRRGIRTQIRNDSSPMVSEIVKYVLAERRAVRWLDAGLRSTAATPLPDYFAVANGMRCFASMRPVGTAGGVLTCARRENELRAVKDLRESLGDLPWTDIEFGYRGALVPLGSMTKGIRHLTRAARLAKGLRRRHDMFHVLRALELVFYYDRIGQILDRGGYRVAVMSSYSNPWGIAMNLAARRRGIPVVHVMHGEPVWPLPRLDYDLAIVNNQASYELLCRAGCRIDRVIVRSAGARYRPLPLALPQRNMTVGLFLSKQPRKECVIAWIRGLLCTEGVESIRLRPHPANLWTGIDAAMREFPRDRVNLSSASADDDLRRCDLVIAGNSSVHIDTLTAGVHSVYSRDLDHSAGGLSLLAEGLVFEADVAGSMRADDVLRFYGAPEWICEFRRHVNLDSDDAHAGNEMRSAFNQFLSAVAA